MLDTYTIDSLSLFGVMILICYGYHLMGLAILKRGRTVDVALTTPLSTIIAGMGVYLLIAIPMIYSGLPIAHSFSSFIFLALVLLVTCRRGLKAVPEAKEMNRVLFILLALTLFPTLAIISQDAVTSANEWQYWLIPNLIQTEYSTLPAAYDIPAWQSTVLQHPPAWYSVPVLDDMFGRFKASQFALSLNLILCVLALISMVRLCDLRIRWSNVAVVTGGLALSFVLLSPMISTGKVLEFQPSIIAACALLALCAPLLKHGELPFRGQAGLTAFAATLLTLAAPEGIFYVGVISLAWILRSMKETKMKRAGCIRGGIFILLAGVLGMSMNRQFVSGYWPWEWQSFMTPSVEALSIVLISTILMLVWFVLSLLSRAHKPASLLLTLALSIVWLLLFIGGKPITEAVLGFVLLVPFWQTAVHLYSTSSYARTTYNSPWAWGGAMMGLAFIAQVFYLPYTQYTHLPKENHILSTLNKFPVQKIAIWDKTEANNYGRWLMMKSDGHINYIDARDWAREAPRSKFRAYLQQKKVDHLLITTPDKTISKLLKTALPQEHVYLLRVDESKFTPVATSLKK